MPCCYIFLEYHSFLFLYVISSKDMSHVSSGPVTSHFHNSPENYAMTEGVVQVGPNAGMYNLIEHEYHEYKDEYTVVVVACAYIHTYNMCLQKITYKCAICTETMVKW